jgi:hypothetical protein
MSALCVTKVSHRRGAAPQPAGGKIKFSQGMNEFAEAVRDENLVMRQHASVMREGTVTALRHFTCLNHLEMHIWLVDIPNQPAKRSSARCGATRKGRRKAAREAKAAGKESQAGDCYRAFEGAQERR